MRGYTEIGRRKAAEQQEDPIWKGLVTAQLSPYHLPLCPYPASSHTRSPMPRSSGERRSYGRNWRSRANCPGRYARHRPGSSVLLHQRPNPSYRTSLSGPSMTSGTQTVSDCSRVQMGGCPRAWYPRASTTGVGRLPRGSLRSSVLPFPVSGVQASSSGFHCCF